MIQVWRYAPVFADSSRIDDISLALSLAAIDDERIQLEVDRILERNIHGKKRCRRSPRIRTVGGVSVLAALSVVGARESAIICLDNLSCRGVTGDGAGRQTYEEQ